MVAWDEGGAYPSAFAMMRGLKASGVFSTFTFAVFPRSTGATFSTFTFTTF